MATPIKSLSSLISLWVKLGQSAASLSSPALPDEWKLASEISESASCRKQSFERRASPFNASACQGSQFAQVYLLDARHLMDAGYVLINTPPGPKGSTFMKKLAFSVTAGAIALAMLVAPALAEGDADLIKSAESAAPAAVSSGATIYAPQADGSMKTLREGTNGFWCMPNDPATPGEDPMCGDANSMEWAMAWMAKKDPPKGKVGLIYMLNGGSDASNTDPYATAPTEGNNWIKTGRHVMIMNATDLMAGYPTDPKPDTSKPYVMWHGTPYAHLMVPVE